MANEEARATRAAPDLVSGDEVVYRLVGHVQERVLLRVATPSAGTPPDLGSVTLRRRVHVRLVHDVQRVVVVAGHFGGILDFWRVNLFKFF